jgi:hypothetical protein
MAWSYFETIWQRFSSNRLGKFLGLADLPPEVAATESVSRFLMSRKHFAETISRVKPAALLPQWNEHRERFETSTHRTDGLRPDQIWAIGYRYVEKNRRIRGRGHCQASLVTMQALHFDVNGEPYPRHVDVVGWPEDEHEQLMRATEIANSMRFEIDPRP